ncbi:polyprenyl synthetase family protein [Fluviispira multicolorata]|uniref:Uncharacterized protein n=1 Tax=Fluviispira multicolorata TaxID=2654512 RepID=A0A833N7V6_9BACT|nr:polyprenyl synthetase family protein [Fluviispira multicolorata]KAB8033371.1 hypothetical protein GCL57_01335 [Fluviispira multicolorata]
MPQSKSTRHIVMRDYQYFSMRLNHFFDKLENDIDKISQNQFVNLGIKESLLELTLSSLNSKAKRIRPLMCSWMLRNFYLKEDFLKDYGEIEKKSRSVIENCMKVLLSVEILHCASLIIDDIEDGSLERRGQQALYVQYGMPNTLNTGTWMYFLAIKNLPLTMQPIAINTLYDCHVGQALDLSNTNKKFIESLFFGNSEQRWEFYNKCAELKTARLLQFSVECLSRIIKIDKSSSQAIHTLIRNYGLSFQIYDDIKNLLPEMSGSKSLEDLNSGLRSALSLAFLDFLSPLEKQSAYNAFLKNQFSDFMLSHVKFKSSLELCFQKAQSYLEKSSLLLDSVSCHKKSREYIHLILEVPLDNIKISVSKVKRDHHRNTSELQSLIL